MTLRNNAPIITGGVGGVLGVSLWTSIGVCLQQCIRVEGDRRGGSSNVQLACARREEPSELGPCDVGISKMRQVDVSDLCVAVSNSFLEFVVYCGVLCNSRSLPAYVRFGGHVSLSFVGWNIATVVILPTIILTMRLSSCNGQILSTSSFP